MNHKRLHANVHRSFLLASSTAVLALSAAAQSTGTVDFTRPLQTMDGFGFADPFGRSGYLLNSPAISAQVVDQLFNPVTGAGASIMRIGIITDSNIEPNAPASPASTPAYSFDGADGGQVWLAQQGQKYGVRRFYQDSWGAPAYMKTNASTSNGGQICGMPGATVTTGACGNNGTADYRQAYANFVVQYAQFYKSIGIPVTDISFVNEPDENVSYASLTLTTAQVTDFLDNYFGPAVTNSGLNLNINCCDLSNWSRAGTYANAVQADPVAASYVNTYTGHEYGVLATTPLSSTKHTWMSEWASANGTAFNDSWDTTENGSNQNNGIHLANDISNAITLGGVSAYTYWYADSVGLTGGFFSLPSQPNAPSFVMTKRLYALAGFARFVRPGAYRVSASTNNTNLAISAFVNTTGGRVMNVINNATTTVTAALSLDAAEANATAASYLTDENNGLAPVSAAFVNGSTLTATLAPRSLTTITLTPAPTAGAVQMIGSPTLFKLGDGTYQAVLQLTNAGPGSAANVQLTAAVLGTAPGSTLPAAAMPFSLGALLSGGTALATVNFGAGAGSSGDRVIARFSGTYNGGSFGQSLRITLP